MWRERAGKHRQAPALAVPLGHPWQSATVEADIILYPFTRQTNPGIAAMLLLQFVSYHFQMGFAKVVQYTQVRRQRARSYLSELFRSGHSCDVGFVWALCTPHAECRSCPAW